MLASLMSSAPATNFNFQIKLSMLLHCIGILCHFHQTLYKIKAFYATLHLVTENR